MTDGKGKGLQGHSKDIIVATCLDWVCQHNINKTELEPFTNLLKFSPQMLVRGIGALALLNGNCWPTNPNLYVKSNTLFTRCSTREQVTPSTHSFGTLNLNRVRPPAVDK